jgi:hypothetical protein
MIEKSRIRNLRYRVSTPPFANTMLSAVFFIFQFSHQYLALVVQ